MSNEWPMRSDSATYLLTHLFTLQFTHPFALRYFIVNSVAWCLHCKLIWYLYVVYRNGDGDSCMRGWMGTGTILKLVLGIGMGMGIRVPGTARVGYKYLPSLTVDLDSDLPTCLPSPSGVARLWSLKLGWAQEVWGTKVLSVWNIKLPKYHCFNKISFFAPFHLLIAKQIVDCWNIMREKAWLRHQAIRICIQIRWSVDTTLPRLYLAPPR